MKFKDIKEKLSNKYIKALIFFGFYLIFFIVLFASMSPNTTPNTEEEKDMWEEISNNYEFRYDIAFSDNLITLEGKRYNNKELFTRKIDNVLDKEIYRFYDDFSIKVADKFEKADQLILVDDKFNNNLLDISYIERIINDGELIKSATNFDGSLVDSYLFNNTAIDVLSENKKIKRIDINDGDYKVSLQYKNINKVKDFTVD